MYDLWKQRFLCYRWEESKELKGVGPGSLVLRLNMFPARYCGSRLAWCGQQLRSIQFFGEIEHVVFSADFEDFFDGYGGELTPFLSVECCGHEHRVVNGFLGGFDHGLEIGRHGFIGN